MDVRTEILKEATRLFAAHGFDGASLKDISDAVGIRKPSLLYHFPSKQDLRLAVLDQLLQRWNEVLPKLLMVTASEGPRFGSVIQELVRFFTEDPDRARLLVREILDRPEDMKERMSTYVVPWITLVADHIRKEQSTGTVYPTVDPEAYVLQVINMVVSGIATASALSNALLPDDAPEGPAHQRHERELMRIASFSLFRAPSDSRDQTVRGQDSAPADALSAKRESV